MTAPRLGSLLLGFGLLAAPSWADSPVIVEASAVKSSGGWRFDVTIAHPDTGWDHYADGWGVYLPDGTELGFRTLLHPHVDEQPFTRSLNGVQVPQGTTQVNVRPRDSLGDWGEAVAVTLP